jgi:hypothetical protein
MGKENRNSTVWLRIMKTHNLGLELHPTSPEALYSEDNELTNETKVMLGRKKQEYLKKASIVTYNLQMKLSIYFITEL